MSKTNEPVVPRKLLVPFILVTLLFPLWGFANDITNPMVAAFKNILLISNFESSLVQGAFYGGYALMAIPAAIFIKKFSYKSGILIGLALYAIGCLLFIPAGWSLSFYPFLLAYLIMTCGLSFLETTANPYILSMGEDSTSTRRLNLAQAFNPMGSILGMFVASMFILVNLNGTSEDGRRAMLKASEGKPIYQQVGEKLSADAKALEETLSAPDWATKKKSLKKASEQSADLAKTLAIAADPKPDRSKAIVAAMADQPKENKFTVAARSVAIVMQLREPLVPSAAEIERDQLFGGPGGLELALGLAKEASLLEGADGFAKAREKWTAATASAAKLSESLAGLYQGKGKTAADTAATTTLAKETSATLNEAAVAIATVPGGQLKAYVDESSAAFKAIQKSDLDIVVGPYAIMGTILLVILGLFAWKLPHATLHEGDNALHIGPTLSRLLANNRYWEGVIAQTAYVGAQIMCWTFIIQYAELELGLSKTTAQNCNILAMMIFVSSRFICTFLLHYIHPGMLLGLLALGGLALTAGTIFIHGYAGLYCLIGVSACMSLMFPTIYGIALKGLGDDAKLGSSGLILAIGGGCLLPVLQGWVLDMPAFDLGFMELASVRASFFLPLICFVVIAVYGLRTVRVHDRATA